MAKAEHVLRNFMYDKGYTQTAVEDSTYIRADGRKTPIKVVSYSNGKSYNVSAQRFWKA